MFRVKLHLNSQQLIFVHCYFLKSQLCCILFFKNGFKVKIYYMIPDCLFCARTIMITMYNVIIDVIITYPPHKTFTFLNMIFYCVYIINQNIKPRSTPPNKAMQLLCSFTESIYILNFINL